MGGQVKHSTSADSAVGQKLHTSPASITAHFLCRLPKAARKARLGVVRLGSVLRSGRYMRRDFTAHLVASRVCSAPWIWHVACVGGCAAPFFLWVPPTSLGVAYSGRLPTKLSIGPM